VEAAAIDPKLMEVFRRDAEKAAVTLRQTIDNGDIKLFTITAHAMKSALGNVGEREKAELAFALEKAGQVTDMGYITANIENFIQILESFKPEAKDTAVELDIAEDTELLSEQLLLIKAACADYDEATAYAALELLKAKEWKWETREALERIHELLYLHSDFEEAGAQANLLGGKL
jgi:HPt (histidine-containing phosphotransfer) domain-containing protein